MSIKDYFTTTEFDGVYLINPHPNLLDYNSHKTIQHIIKIIDCNLKKAGFFLLITEVEEVRDLLFFKYLEDQLINKNILREINVLNIFNSFSEKPILLQKT